MKVIDFKDAKCKHCYKCVRHCEVKAISVEKAQAHIMENHCIHCGHCLEVCPQNAKTFASDMQHVKGFLAGGEKVVVSMAPSYLGILDYDHPEQVVGGLVKLGFSEVRETAEGAALVTRRYWELLKEGKMDNIITTCCPSANDLIEKYYPSLVPLMAPVVSPMIAHGRLIKKMYGDEVRVVFLGPCVAKKSEALEDPRVRGAIDAILTFEEVVRWWEEEGIDIRTCDRVKLANPLTRVNQLYPVGGGIIRSIRGFSVEDNYYKIHVDGLKACMELFSSLEKGEIQHAFFEINVCDGGCVKGPATNKWDVSYVKAKMDVEDQAIHREAAEEIRSQGISLDKTFGGREIQDKKPQRSDVEKILHLMGKYSKEDELNCGACGYNTCREKAQAVYQNKAEVGMCLPFALSKTETISDVVLDVTPSIIMIVDRHMMIQECNKNAQEMLGISRKEALTRYIYEFIDETDIQEVLNTHESIVHRKVCLTSMKMTAEESIIYIPHMDAVLITYLDISKEEHLKAQRYQLKVDTVEAAQRVIDKQMMIAQEIAGLLGETTAETKVTLNRLRNSILESED